MRGQSFLDFEKRSKSSTLFQQWDHEKNSIKPSDVSAKNSRIKIWWSCSEKHSFESTIYNRRQGKGCPYCSGRRKYPAGSKLSELYPELEALFDIEANKTPFAETLISTKTIWRCLDYPDHRWSSTPRKNLECIYCTNRKVLERFNDVVTTDPGVVQFFAPDNDFKLTEVTRGSNKKARWSCPQGHVFEARVKERVNTLNGCPVCSGRRFDPKIHSFSAVHPELVHEWIRSVDSELSIDQVRFTSSDKALWRCPKGHVYESRYNARHSGKGCNICAGKKILVGFNDLESQRPDLVTLLETDIDPQTVHCGSTSVLTWRCRDCQKNFETSLSSLQTPSCISCRRSQGETELFEFLTELQENLVVNDRKVLSGMEIDIYDPSRRLGVEFNGDYWHSSKVLSHNLGKTSTERHLEKLSRAKKAGIELAFVWENDWNKKRDAIQKALTKFFKTRELSPILTKTKGVMG